MQSNADFNALVNFSALTATQVHGFLEQLGRFFSAVSIADILFAGAKSLCFGLAIACISCFHGLNVGRSATAVPLATVRAVVQSLIAVFLIDGVFGYVRYVAF